jgi:hypothetical protein
MTASDTGTLIVIGWWQLKMSLARKVFDLLADFSFEPARVEESVTPALSRTDTLLARALATTGLTDIYDVRASLNP